MKLFLISVAILISGIAFGAGDTIRMNTKITDVTVFFSGAQVTRHADLKASKGKHVIILNKLSHEINDKSIQVDGIPDCSILSVRVQPDYQSEVKKSAPERSIQNKLDSLEMKIKVLKNRSAVYDIEEKLLIDNSNLQKKDGGTTLGEIRDAADFYRSRLNEIRQGKLSISTELDLMNKKIQDLYAQMNELTSDARKNYSQVQITVDCEKEIAAGLNVRYLVVSAGWTPYYDFRVEDITKPINIDYNANVFQTTGEDWKNINIRLSGNNPTLSGSKPELPTWYLGQAVSAQPVGLPRGSGSLKGRVTDGKTNEPIPFANVVILQGNEQKGGSTTDFDGNFIIKPVPAGYYAVKVSYVGYEPFQMNNLPVFGDKITFQNFQMKANSVNLQEVEVTEYKVPLISKDQTISGATITSEDFQRYANKSANALANTVGGISGTDYRKPASPPVVESFDYISNTLKTNIANLEYTINIPYSIPSDGSDYSIRIKEVSVPVGYVYHVVPKLDKDVFLTAEIKDWIQLNLLSGKAGIYYQGTYTGETFIDANQYADTLKVSLGRDRNILVKREGNKEMNDRRFMGSDIRETVGWNITVRNNKESKARIVVMDQFPISLKKSIEVEQLESSGAKLDTRTGKLIWDFELEAGAKKVLTFKFSVKYPKYSGISLE